MKTCEEIRHANLLILIEEAGGVEQLAEKYDCTEAYIKQMRAGYKDSKSGSPKGIGTGSARRLEECMGKERGWMDHEPIESQKIERYPFSTAAIVPIMQEPSPPDPVATEILTSYQAMSQKGKIMLLGQAQLLAALHPEAKANRAS